MSMITVADDNRSAAYNSKSSSSVSSNMNEPYEKEVCAQNDAFRIFNSVLNKPNKHYTSWPNSFYLFK